MVSAERVIEYGALDPEPPLKTLPPHQPPPSSWPSRGEIAMEDICFRHSLDSPVVLKNLSCYIQPAEHVRCIALRCWPHSYIVNQLAVMQC